MESDQYIGRIQYPVSEIKEYRELFENIKKEMYE
jgi:hypothetical protein